jgi:predicted nucleic-acid-binding Zn-ribbon protein
MLGPQICVKCRAAYNYEKISEDVVRWYCPKCGETESRDYAMTIPNELFEEIFGQKFPGEKF